MTKRQKIEKFIEDNDLTFEEGSRNTHSVPLAGYACYLNILTPGMILDVLNEVIVDFDYDKEFGEVFKYAKANNYGNFWTTSAAEKEYIFEN